MSSASAEITACDAARAHRRPRSSSGLPRPLLAAFAILPAAALLACGGSAPRGDSPVASSGAKQPPAPLAPLARADALWLERVAFGLDSASVALYRELGRDGFLERQLQPQASPTPPSLAAAVDGPNAARPDLVQVLAGLAADRRAVNALPDGPDKQQARKALDERGNESAYRASRSPAAAGPVFARAAAGADGLVLAQSLQRVSAEGASCAGWSATTRSERSARTRSAVSATSCMATLEHPAMLQYLDNDRNAVGPRQ